MQDIILHLGAHRTASTHVQGVMGNNEALLAKAGIGAPRQRPTHAALTSRLSGLPPVVPNGFNRFIRECGFETRKTLVISDENILGFLNNIFAHGTFYPQTARRLKRLRQFLPVAPRKVVFSIRPYDSFFASAYGRWLTPERMVIPRADVAELVLGLRRGWHDVAADIIAAFPESELVFSEYSSQPGFGPAQLGRILGPLSKTLAYNPGYRWNRSMSARQTMLYERAITDADAEKASEIRTWKRFKQPKLVDEFWDEPTREALTARYLADRARIIAQFPAFVTSDAFEAQDLP